MKLFFVVISLLSICNLQAQQSMSLKMSVDKNKASAFAASTLNFNDLYSWGLIGLGNLNIETLKDVNVGAKLSGYKRLNKAQNSFTTLYFSINKNARNNDSLLSTTFLFPDIGNASAAFTLEHMERIGRVKNDNINLIGGFLDFSYKDIRAEKDKVQRQFGVLQYALGVKYINWYHTSEADFMFSMSIYSALVNVPDEDNEDYRTLFGVTELKSQLFSLGFKPVIQINNLQFYADFRTTSGNEKKIPVRSLRGFNANIGVVFNIEFLEK